MSFLSFTALTEWISKLDPEEHNVIFKYYRMSIGLQALIASNLNLQVSKICNITTNSV